jgi:hypothetical protein
MSRCPANPTIAGNNVSATRTAMATVPAADRPMTVRNGIPTTVRPASAMRTVVPANTTALPAVAAATPTASSGGFPFASSDRYRDRMNTE